MQQAEQDGQRCETRAEHSDHCPQPASVDHFTAADRAPFPHRLHVTVGDEPGRGDCGEGDEYAHRDEPPSGPKKDRNGDYGTTDRNRDLDREPAVRPVSRVVRSHAGRTSPGPAGVVYETLAAPAGVHRKGQGDHDSTDRDDTCDPVNRPERAHGSVSRLPSSGEGATGDKTVQGHGSHRSTSYPREAKRPRAPARSAAFGTHGSQGKVTRTISRLMVSGGASMRRGP